MDESGGADVLCQTTPSSTPVYVIAGLIVPEDAQKDLVGDFLQMKKTHAPTLQSVPLSALIAYEIKGADLRADIRSGTHRRTRRAMGLLDKTLRLLEHHSCRVLGRIIVKDPNATLDDRGFYSSSIRWICHAFHDYTERRESQGLVILDSRTKVKNTPNTNVITTQRYQHGGDPFRRFGEVPVFGHSDSHVALQVADLLASALLFPMACNAYCQALTWNIHPHPVYGDVTAKFGWRVKNLQHRYFDANTAAWKGGIWSSGSSGGLRPVFHAPIGSPTQVLALPPSTP